MIHLFSGLSSQMPRQGQVIYQKINTSASKTCSYRKWQDYVYIQCEYKSTKQKIKHLLREENKVKENKIS